MVFGTYDVQIELNVVARNHLRLGQTGLESGEHLLQRPSISGGPFRGDTVDLLRIVGNGETIRANDHVLYLDQSALRIVQLPGQLNKAGPIG